MAATLALAIGCDTTPVNDDNAPTDSRAFLAVAGFTTLNLLDLETGEWIGPYGLGNGPNWIVPHNDYLYVINSLSNDLSRFRMVEGTVTDLGTVDIGLAQNRNPYAGAIANDSTMFVSNLLENTVSEVSIPDGTVREIYDTAPAPEGVLVVGDMLYVVCTGYGFQDFTFHTGRLYERNLTTGATRQTIELGVNPQFIATDAEGDLHISTTGNYDDITGEMWSIVRGSGQTKTNRFPLPHYPGRLTVSPWDRVYVAAGGWSSEGDEAGLVLHYDPASPGDRSPLSTSLGAVDVAAFEGEDGTRRLYVACLDAAVIEKYEAGAGTSLTPTTTHSLQDPPQALAIWEL